MDATQVEDYSALPIASASLKCYKMHLRELDFFFLKKKNDVNGRINFNEQPFSQLRIFAWLLRVG